jgi:hypothetical protein
MNILRVVKRSPTAVRALADLNPSVFRYYLDTIEIQSTAVRDGLKPAFLGMLDELLRPDDNNPNIDGNWSFSNPVNAQTVIGGIDTVINTYTGVKYIYRQAQQIMLTSLIPANLGGYTGRTFKSTFNPATNTAIYIETSNLDEITHGELQDGQVDHFLPIQDLEGTPRILPTFLSVGAGYGAIQSGEQGTHGMDELGVYRPLSYWDRTISATEAAGSAEYYGILRESVSGFILNTSKIMFSTTQDGEALARYNPIDLITYAGLIKLHYTYRLNATFEGEI